MFSSVEDVEAARRLLRAFGDGAGAECDRIAYAVMAIGEVARQDGMQTKFVLDGMKLGAMSVAALASGVVPPTPTN